MSATCFMLLFTASTSSRLHGRTYMYGGRDAGAAERAGQGEQMRTRKRTTNATPSWRRRMRALLQNGASIQLRRHWRPGADFVRSKTEKTLKPSLLRPTPRMRWGGVW